MLDADERERRLYTLRARLIERLVAGGLFKRGNIGVTTVMSGTNSSSVLVNVDGERVGNIMLYNDGKLFIYLTATQPPRTSYTRVGACQARELCPSW